MTRVERAFQLQQYIMKHVFVDVDFAAEAEELDRLCHIMTDAEQSQFLDLCAQSAPINQTK